MSKSAYEELENKYILVNISRFSRHFIFIKMSVPGIIITCHPVLCPMGNVWFLMTKKRLTVIPAAHACALNMTLNVLG